MIHSIIQKSRIEGQNRLDAEFFQLAFLQLEKKLIDTGRARKWSEIKGRFITGPFGSAFNVENYEEKGKYRYIRGKDVKQFFLKESDNVYVPEKDFKRLNKYALKANDLLISVVGTLGNSIIIEDGSLPAVFSCKSTAFRTDTIDQYYFLAYLNSKYGKSLLLRSIRGAVQTGLNIDDLRSLVVFVATKSDQEKISKIVKEGRRELDLSKRHYLQAENLLLEELGLSDYETRSDIVFSTTLSELNDAKRIDADYFQPKYNELISKLKKTKKLSELAKRKSGILKPVKENEYKYTEISDVNVSNGSALSNDILGSELPANAKIEVKGGELAISKVRPTRGAIAIIPENWNENHIVSGAFSVFDVDSPMKEYLQVVLRSMIGKLQMERPTTGTSYPTITDQDVENLVIPVLPRSIQEKIADLVRKSHEARKKSKELLDEAKRKVEELIEKGQ